MNPIMLPEGLSKLRQLNRIAGSNVAKIGRENVRHVGTHAMRFCRKLDAGPAPANYPANIIAEILESDSDPGSDPFEKHMPPSSGS